MRTLRIKNVGSIVDAEFEVKQINVFMGPQASGKSTIAKILSQALWAEKNFLTTGKKYDFYEGLMSFHNMDRNYFSKKDLEIVYNSPWCTIKMLYQERKRYPQTSYRKGDTKVLFSNAKIEYVPAERNVVSSIPGILEVAGRDSIASFAWDWHRSKRDYQRSRKYDVDLPDLGFSYRYKESEERDIIRTSSGEEVDLQFASSGQQSILPLLLVTDEVMQGIYAGQKMFSPREVDHIKNKAGDELVPLVEILSSLGRKKRNKTIEKELNKLWKQIGYNPEYGCTHLIIEEPEQNLYPSTQRGLLQKLVNLTTEDKKHCHTLTLTTHSPFILYALDNCMLAGLAKAKGADLSGVELKESIEPSKVGLWLLKDGGIETLQDERQLLKSSLFNEEFQQQHELMYQIMKLMPQDDDREPKEDKA